MSEPDRIASLLAEQRTRWQNGEAPRVEAYLEQHPALRQDADAVLDLIYNEVFLRAQRGDTPGLPEYLERFPQYAAELRLQFEVHDALDVEEEGPTGPAPEEHTIPPERLGPDLVARSAAVPGYEILGELGRGGMGVVYQARQTALKRLVALKMILAGAHASPRVRERFRTEAEAIARLQHPNIVQIHEVGEHAGQPFLSLELVDGGSLAQRLGGKPEPPRAAAERAETLARAMHHAHQHGIIHRDLKPSNVLLTADGVPKITDFGLAKLLDDSGSGGTPTEAFLGTPNYMAPEQARGQAKHLGPPADVYSLGAILYELLTGRPPFQGATLLDVLEQVRTQEPVAPSRLQPKVPRDLETICLKCLEKEPERRYPTALDLADDLRRFRADEPIRARPTPVVRRAAQWARRHPAPTAVLATGFLAVLVVSGLLGSFGADRAARRREQQKVERERDEKQARLEAEALSRRFFGERDDGLFHAVTAGMEFTGLDTAASLKAAREAADRALALVSAEDGTPALDPYWNEREQADVRDGGYELLLVLADALLRAAPPGGGPSPDVAEAGRLLDRAAHLRPVTWAYHVRRARYLAATGQTADAGRETDEARALQPTTAADFFLQGDEYYRGGAVKQARHAFDQALHRRPDHFWAQFYVALCDLDRGEMLAAEEGLTACLGHRQDFVWTYLVRGAANTQLREFDDAEGDFRHGFALQPNPDARYALLVNRGILRTAEGRFAEARQDLEEARALKPGRIHAYLNLAELARSRKDYPTVLARLEDVLRREPSSRVRAQVYALQADVFYHQDRLAEAVAACDRALQGRPGDAEVLKLKARALLTQGRHREAEQAFSECLARGGGADADVYSGRGAARVRLGRYADAVQDYSLALAGRPSPGLYNHRGWAYVLLEAWRLGLADFAEALRGDPRGVDPLIGHAYCRVKLGEHREAVEEAEEAWRRGPRGAEMWHNLACVFAQAAGAARDPALAARYRARTVEALREGLSQVSPADRRQAFWREQMSPDPALDPIRDSAEFRALSAEYTRGGRPK